MRVVRLSCCLLQQPGRFVDVADNLAVLDWFLGLVAGAQLTARMVAGPDCFMDEEQRQIQRDLSELRAEVKALLEGSL